MILVIGGAGYIGSVLVPDLLKCGKKVRVIDNLIFGDAGLESVKSKIDLVVKDIRKIGHKDLEGVESVINLAGFSNDSTANHEPKKCYEVNTVSTERIAHLCREMGIKRFIYASTCSIYDHEVLGSEGVFSEESSVAPRGSYAISKSDAEDVLKAMVGKEFCPVILRKGTCHGFSPRMRFDLVVNTFVKEAMTKGTFRVLNAGLGWRPTVDVRDLARAYICCLEADKEAVSGQIFNVANENLRVIEIADIVLATLKEMMGRTAKAEIDRRDIHNRSYRVSIEKIRKTLGFEPKYSLKQSVRDIITALKRNRFADYGMDIYDNFRWMTRRRNESHVSVR